MSEARREAYKRLFPNSDPDAIGTHAPDCHTYHPACAFHAGYTAAEKAIAEAVRELQKRSQGETDYEVGRFNALVEALAIIEGTTDE